MPRLDTQTANTQIQQMVEFIKQEAHEKKQELEVKTEAEFNIEKLRLIEQHKARIRKEFEDKATELATRRKIEYSVKINEMRMKTVSTRDESVNKVRQDTLDKLHEVSQSPQYATLLKGLIVQGLIRLREGSVVIRCRKEDVSVVSSVLADASKEYSDVMRRQVGGEWKSELVVDQAKYLSPGKALAGTGLSCSGGVMLFGHRGRIMLDQTLDQRLNLCLGQLKPLIREIMFPSEK
eukprot:107870_1